MGQVKKAHVRDAILASAKTLFAEHGYYNTSLPRIAAGAGVSTANVYVYFRSKIEILYEIYDPWLRARLDRLADELTRIDSPFERLRHVLGTFWRDIPAEEGGFGNNIIQAISTFRHGEGYRPTLLYWMEQHLQGLVLACLTQARRKVFAGIELGHFLVMAFDGYIVYHHLDPKRPLDEVTLDAVCRMLYGGGPAKVKRPRKPARKPVRKPVRKPRSKANG